MAASNWYWRELFQSLDRWGLTDVLLPFLLVFTIIFAVLQKTKILGEDSKKYNVILSFTMGFIFVMPHLIGRPVLGYDPVELLNRVLPTVSILVVAVILLLILIGVFAADEYRGAEGFYGIIVLVAVILIIYVFGAAANWWSGWSWLNGLLGGSDTIAVLVMLVVFGLIIGFVTGDEKSDKTPGGRFMDSFDKLFKKRG